MDEATAQANINQQAACLHVAVGVIHRNHNEILIAKRPAHVPQGDLWEFPGGKVEPGESVQAALARELNEELGIDVVKIHPLIQIKNHFKTQNVLLNVWRVSEFKGEAYGREGQPIRWIPLSAIDQYSFPQPNRPIIHALKLPATYLVTGEFNSVDDFMLKLQNALQCGVRLVRIRAKMLSRSDYKHLAKRAIEYCHALAAKVMIDDPTLIEAVEADGVHLTEQALLNYQKRPVSNQHWLAASVHDKTSIVKATALGVDFMTLSPILPTSSHPQCSTLGWGRFEQLVAYAGAPVYALGGLSLADIEQAKQAGGQGISAISALWSR